MKTASLIKSAFLSLSVLALMCKDLPATDVSGTIVNQVWVSANSPYRVVGNIQVAGLTIRPGVTVFFTSNYVFEVAGTLKAIGTPSLPILFTAANAGWQGLFFNSSRPGCELAHCIVERSVNSGIRIVSSAPLISDCIIRSNSVAVQEIGGDGTVSLLEAGGGGIRTDTPLTLDNCVVERNSVTSTVQGSKKIAVGRGGGIYSTAPLTLLNCTISSNSVSAKVEFVFLLWDPESSVCEGGGVWSGSELTLQSCIVRGNTIIADSRQSGLGNSSATSLGGGTYSKAKSLQRNSIIAGNTTAGFRNTPVFQGTVELKGGGLYSSGGPSSIENCTIAFNSPDGLASVNTAKLLNSIVWGNGTNQVVGAANVTYCDVQGGIAGSGNINNNPILLSSDDLIVVPGSPCVNAGDTNAAFRNVFFPPSLGHTRNDQGAHGGPGAGARLRARQSQQFEVIFLGGVPGYAYLIQGSTNLLDWETVQQVQIAHVGDAAYFLEPSTNTLPERFYRLNLAP